MATIEAIRAKLRLRDRKDGFPNPLDVEDTGTETCAICDHKRSAVDGVGQCLLCVFYLYMKEG